MVYLCVVVLEPLLRQADLGRDEVFPSIKAIDNGLFLLFRNLAAYDTRVPNLVVVGVAVPRYSIFVFISCLISFYSIPSVFLTAGSSRP